ncbi:hypothetical protein [Paraburkholderia humisilvae]|uniref:Uncharacterized protein n=1 Tax=Paraburkholderia humisilvae TaxID=627669 RepID=A0A6J5EC71_9BURK|nr:hypothetical protein [Paraburkholderia humisilvae]CAB3764069.1 hypothetical protein LMG29542_04771 [Paraburkholderia humisilvae]
MSTLYVQFSDATQSTICSVFSCSQDTTEFPNQGEIDTSDARWKTYCDTMPAQVRTFLPTPTSG